MNKKKKCLLKMKKAELLDEALKMCHALIMISEMDLAYRLANYASDDDDAWVKMSGEMCGIAKRALMSAEELAILDSL